MYRILIQLFSFLLIITKVILRSKGDELLKFHFVLGIDINSYLFNQGQLLKRDQSMRKTEQQILLSTIESLNRYIKDLEERLLRTDDGVET